MQHHSVSHAPWRGILEQGSGLDDAEHLVRFLFPVDTIYGLTQSLKFHAFIPKAKAKRKESAGL